MYDGIRYMQMYADARYKELDIKPKTANEAPLKLMRNYESIDEVLHNYKKPYEEAKEKIEKKKVLENFREDLAEMLSKEYKWPKQVSQAVAYFAKPEHSNQEKKASDYIIGITLGGLPKRYAEPLAKIMKIETSFITDVSVKYSLGAFAIHGALAYAVPEAGEFIQQNVDQTLALAGNAAKTIATIEGAILAINTAIKFVEIPYRTHKHFKDKEHTPAPSEIFDPLIIPGVIKGYLFFHNIKETLKEKTRTETPTKTFPTEDIINYYKDS